MTAVVALVETILGRPCPRCGHGPHHSGRTVADCRAHRAGVIVQELAKDGRLGPGCATDALGRFCGQDGLTGFAVPAPAGKVGYCGPDCVHCAPMPVYALNGEGVWVCAADSDRVG